MSGVGWQSRNPDDGFWQNRTSSHAAGSDRTWVGSCCLGVDDPSAAYCVILRETRNPPVSLIAGPIGKKISSPHFRITVSLPRRSKIAAEVLGLSLYPPSKPGHDAYDENGVVQIKLTAGKAISMYDTCDRLVVLLIVSPHEAEVVYDGPGEIAWLSAGPMAKNGQRRIRLARLRALAEQG